MGTTFRAQTLIALGLAIAACNAAEDAPAGREGVSSVRVLPHYNSPDFTPRWDVAANDANFHKIRPFKLIDQSGAEFSEADLSGKIVVADFFFTSCPSICVKMAVSMRGIQEAFIDDADVLLLSHSVTPDEDTPEVLSTYGAAKGVDIRRWKLLTGRRDEIYDLGRRYYFVEEDLGVQKGSGDFLHTENFVLLDRNQHLRGIYNSLDPQSMAALVADIKVLAHEE